MQRLWGLFYKRIPRTVFVSVHYAGLCTNYRFTTHGCEKHVSIGKKINRMSWEEREIKLILKSFEGVRVPKPEHVYRDIWSYRD